MIKKRVAKNQSRKRALSEERVEDSAATAEGESSEAGGAEKVDLQELIALRRLQKIHQRGGIDVQKLNRGAQDKKRAVKEKTESDGEAEGEDDPDGTYGLQPKRVAAREADDDEFNEDAEQKARKLVRSNNFTQQTNALDVDKHMMAYIEEGIKKKRGEQGIKDDEPVEETPYDPHEELYQIDERYRIEKKIADEEGNVTNSMAMLTAIPEVDLGMDVRLKNIEETEKAKRLVAEGRRNRHHNNPNDIDLGATRFQRPHQNQTSDADALRLARLAAQGVQVPNEHRRPRGDRHETATDEQVMERFKKRMRK